MFNSAESLYFYDFDYEAQEYKTKYANAQRQLC